MRCQKSRRVCEGYPQGAPVTADPNASEEEEALVPVRFDASSTFQSPKIVSHPSFGHGHELDRLHFLARTILSQGVPGARTQPESAFWKSLVPQFTHSIPSVRAAAAAFGASYEHQVLKRQSAAARVTAMKQIAAAVSKIREDVVRLPHGPLPILVACVLLASAETLQYRHTDALLHLRGAFSVMSMRGQVTTSSAASGEALLDDDISTLFQKLDLQVVTYALGESSALPFLIAEPAADSDPGIVTTQQRADRTLFRILHFCYDFAFRANPFKYLPHAAARQELRLEQNRHIAELTAWASQYQPTKQCSLDAPSTTNRLHDLVLRAHCLSALIYVSNVLEPHEKAYDKYASQFQEIIKCVEQTISSGPSATSLPTFNVEMGVIQPLFLTAVKYRDSFWRSKAVTLLHKCGREGPWCGYVEGTVAACVARAEAKAAPDLTITSLDGEKTEIIHCYSPDDIPESARVSGCSILDILKDSSVVKWAVVQLSRCRDVKTMLADSEIPPSDLRHWIIWNETYELPFPNK